MFTSIRLVSRLPPARGRLVDGSVGNILIQVSRRHFTTGAATVPRSGSQALQAWSSLKGNAPSVLGQPDSGPVLTVQTDLAVCASQTGWLLLAWEDLWVLRRKMQGPLLDCPSVCTVLAALSQMANVTTEAHVVMWRALIQQVSSGRPALAANSVSVPGVLRRVEVCVSAAVQCVARFVFESPDFHRGPVFLQAVLHWSNKAGTVSLMHRSAWPGRCAVAGGGNGRWSRRQSHQGWSPESPVPQQATLCNGVSVEGRSRINSHNNWRDRLLSSTKHSYLISHCTKQVSDWPTLIGAKLSQVCRRKLHNASTTHHYQPGNVTEVLKLGLTRAF